MRSTTPQCPSLLLTLKLPSTTILLMPYTTEERQQVAAHMPRDPHGHFAPKSSASPQSPHVHFDHNQDDLLNVHVGNPLSRITKLLEDIKRQKAFSFTLKGSLGIMGVALVLSTFGLFGGTKLLCNKGRQTHMGILTQLQTNDHQESTLPLIGPVIEYYSNLMHPEQITNPKKRIVLQTPTTDIIYLPYTKNVDYSNIINTNSRTIYVTGNYDSCSKTLVPQEQSDVEIIIPPMTSQNTVPFPPSDLELQE